MVYSSLVPDLKTWTRNTVTIDNTLFMLSLRLVLVSIRLVLGSVLFLIKFCPKLGWDQELLKLYITLKVYLYRWVKFAYKAFKKPRKSFCIKVNERLCGHPVLWYINRKKERKNYHDHLTIHTAVPVLYNRKHPVPYVFFACPCFKHICPTKAACWSPRHCKDNTGLKNQL